MSDRFKERRDWKDLACECAITLCRAYAGLSRGQIAALVGLPSGDTVAQTIRRTKAKEAQTLAVLKYKLSHK
jgi:hypothetical protein